MPSGSSASAPRWCANTKRRRRWRVPAGRNSAGHGRRAAITVIMAIATLAAAQGTDASLPCAVARLHAMIARHRRVSRVNWGSGAHPPLTVHPAVARRARAANRVAATGRWLARTSRGSCQLFQNYWGQRARRPLRVGSGSLSAMKAGAREEMDHKWRDLSRLRPPSPTRGGIRRPARRMAQCTPLSRTSAREPVSWPRHHVTNANTPSPAHPSAWYAAHRRGESTPREW